MKKKGRKCHVRTGCSYTVPPLGGDQRRKPQRVLLFIDDVDEPQNLNNKETVKKRLCAVSADVGAFDVQKRKPSRYQSWRAASTGLLWCRWPPWRSRWWRQQCSESQKRAVWGRRRLAARRLTLWTKNTKLTHSLYLLSLRQSLKVQKIRLHTNINLKDSLCVLLYLSNQDSLTLSQKEQWGLLW